MVQGPNDLPELSKAAAIKAPPTAGRPKAAEPLPQAFQAPDQVQLSPQAVQASQLLERVKAEPDLRPGRVEEVRANLSAIVGDGASLDAKLAEKLLTEN